MKHLWCCVLSVVIVLSACGESASSRSKALSSIADDLVIPGFNDVLEKARALDQSLIALCGDSLGISPIASKKSLDDMRASWYGTKAVWVGPVMENKTMTFVDYPIKTSDIDTRLSEVDLIPLFDEETVSKRLGADERGLGTIEYLLDSEKYKGVRACQYALSVSKVIVAQVGRVVEAWTSGRAPYRYIFDGTAKGTNDETSLDYLVNAQINTLNELKKMTLDEKDRVRDAEVSGVKAVLVGRDKHSGLSELLGPELTSRIANQSNVEELHRIVSTEVVGKLGTTIGFSDLDGDSAG